MLGFLPTGAEHAAAAPSTTGTAERAAAAAAITPDGSAPSTPSHHQHQVSTVSMFWSLPWREYDDWRARPLEEWKETIVSLQPRAAGLMQHIRSHDDLTLATYSDVVMRRFVSCNIGEAAPQNLRVLGLECAPDDTCLLLVCVVQCASGTMRMPPALSLGRVPTWHLLMPGSSARPLLAMLANPQTVSARFMTLRRQCAQRRVGRALRYRRSFVRAWCTSLVHLTHAHTRSPFRSAPTAGQHSPMLCVSTMPTGDGVFGFTKSIGECSTHDASPY